MLISLFGILHEVWVNKVKKRHSQNFEKSLIAGIRGSKCQNLGFLGSFSETGLQKVPDFLHDGIESNRLHHRALLVLCSFV